MALRRVACAALIAAFFASSVQLVQAFYDDTHYGLTYYIARSCGYTPLQAYRIASANLSVDYAPLTEPVQVDQFKGRSPYDAVGAALSEILQNARVRFHAMSDNRLGSLGVAPGAIRGRELELEAIAKAQKNPGVLLHYVQDEAPHDGYSSFGGHWMPSVDDVNSSMVAPFGPMTDFLSYDQRKTMSMVDRTIATLTRFMRTMSPRQRSGGARCDVSAMLPVLKRLVDVNQVSGPAKDYARQIDELLAELRKLGPAARVPAFLSRIKPIIAVLLPAMDAGPKVENSDPVIADALGARELEPYKPTSSRVRYTYTDTGRNPLSDLPPFAIYGTLNATVRGAQGRKVGISVWAEPTRLGDRPYQLTECKESSYQFENLPVGNLIVQSVADGKVTRTRFRLERSEQTLAIDIAPAKKDESACHQEAAKMAAQVCSMAASSATANLDQPRPVEEQLEQKLDECKQEDEKKNTEEEQKQTQQQSNPSPPTPPGGGGSGGGIGALGWGALLGGSLIGGAYLWEQSIAAEEALNSGGSGTNTGTGTNTGSSGFNGTFRAQVTRTCQAGPFPAVCGQAIENSTCSPTNFTFTVTRGTVRDCGGWFNASVSASGTWSGTYTGSAPNIPLSGSIPGTLQGSITSQGSAYQVRIVVTRQ